MSILQKTHTSTGNRKVFTWACWFKESEIPGGNRYLFSLSDDNGANYDESRLFIDAGGRLNYVASDLGVQVEGELAIRDPGSWMHIMVAVDTTLNTSFDRVKLYLNGRRIEDMSISTMPARDANVAHNVGGNILVIGSYGNSNTSFRIDGYMSDVYNVDGLALTPDVFGFYKDGNGYISAGTTQTTDFRPGQWVPKKPSVIKNTINNNGGLGVNGFYLPMNDSSNFGADFHCDPNSIITLKGEDLPQPRNGAPDTTDAYVSQLRSDPYAANLVLAVPGIGTAIGADIVSNGYEWTGASGTTPPTGWYTTGSTATYSVNSDGQLVYNRNGDGTGSTAKFSQDLTTVNGKVYHLVLDLVARTTGGFVLDVGGAINVFASTTDTGIKRYTFTATSTTTTISMRNSSSIGTLIIDNVKVRQVDDAPRDYSADIKGSGTNKTLTANGNAGVGYEIPSYYGSALSFDGSGDYFTHASNSDFQFGTSDFTVEFWMKRTDSGTNVGLLDTRTTNTDGNGWFIRFNAATTIQLVDNATQYASLTHSSDWNHIAFVRDSNLITGYVNGVAGGLTTDVSKNFSSSNFLLGGFVDTQASPNAYGGQIQDLRVYKGVAKYTGGFDVPKPYTPVGIGTWRAVPDCTANNFATLNPLANAVAATLTNGNLQAQPTGANDKHVFSTFGFTSGKWYVEVRDVDQQARGNILVSDANHNATTTGTNNVSVQMWDGTVATSGTDNGNLSAFSTGDILAIAYDADIGSVWIAKNEAVDTSGTAMATGISTTPERDYRFSYRETGGTQTTTNWNFGQNPTFSGQVSAASTQRNADSNGKGEFRYAPPSGFLALCEDNLPTPAISDPGDYFKTVLYKGDSNDGRSITGIGFQPDMVWIKERDSTSGHFILDSVRGATYYIRPNNFNAEDSNANTIKSFDTDGFTVGNSGAFNVDNTYVAWCWKVGAGTTSVNTDGTIDSVVSVNQDAGVSIVTYTSTGSNTATETVGHGLNKAPNMIILKNRSAAVNWRVYHSGINDAGKNSVTLNIEEAAYVFWPSVGSDTFGLANSTTTGQAAGTGNQDIVAYCWTEIESFSKFGSYVGNGNADGPFVYCGFKPAWVMIKSSTVATNWYIFDNSRKTINPITAVLFPNTNDRETDNAHDVDFLSNGFKVRQASGFGGNNSGATYIFAAFAESPFKTANAK